uniref:GM07658p n=1 Tax=Drosophila melanogaster TaxID=7227 RepID=Q86MQ4_DROME|nr:GM07658p [Drosophila melanogaster]
MDLVQNTCKSKITFFQIVISEEFEPERHLYAFFTFKNYFSGTLLTKNVLNQKDNLLGWCQKLVYLFDPVPASLDQQ